jgi:hypothetical protein
MTRYSLRSTEYGKTCGCHATDYVRGSALGRLRLVSRRTDPGGKERAGQSCFYGDFGSLGRFGEWSMTILGRAGAMGTRGTGGTALMRMERTSGPESESASESESESEDELEDEDEESVSDESGSGVCEARSARDSYTPRPRF